VGIVVRLTRVDERLLTPLLSVAVAETKPDEVMPPVEAPPGWSQPRRDAFCEFYRSHYRGLNGPTRTLIYGILCNSVVAETTAANAAAIKVLRRCSAVLVFDGSQVHAEIPVRPASSAADTESDS
jgi:hypothetical protein